MTNWQTKESKFISGNIKVPGDKSISHRSIMFAALANGCTEIKGFLQGDDCIATRAAFEKMGVNIRDEKDKIIIDGVGLYGLTAPKDIIDVGNSGTGMRLLSGLLAGQKFSSTIIGDSSLMTRPMSRIAKPLSNMGALIRTLENGCAPINIEPSPFLKGIDYQQSIASAQVKSALLLAGLYSKGKTTIKEPGISRDHTERMLKKFGYQVDSKIIDGNKITTIVGGGELTASDITVPSDISSAAFYIVAKAISKDTHNKLIINQVGINPTRIGVINILKLMGADISFENEDNGAEPIADIVIRSSKLSGIEVHKELVPIAIDEFPIIFIAAACADGQFVLRNAKELRVKESDRITAMVKGMKELGVDCSELSDGIVIRGNPDNPFPNSGTVNSLTDHRIAMSFAIAGIRAQKGIRILDCDNVATSFPNFIELAREVGIDISKSN